MIVPQQVHLIPDDKLLTQAQLAARLNVSSAAICKAWKLGRIHVWANPQGHNAFYLDVVIEQMKTRNRAPMRHKIQDAIFSNGFAPPPEIMMDQKELYKKPEPPPKNKPVKPIDINRERLIGNAGTNAGANAEPGNLKSTINKIVEQDEFYSCELKRLKVFKTQMEVDVSIGKLCDVEDVEEKFSGLIIDARDRLLGISGAFKNNFQNAEPEMFSFLDSFISDAFKIIVNRSSINE